MKAQRLFAVALFATAVGTFTAGCGDDGSGSGGSGNSGNAGGTGGTGGTGGQGGMDDMAPAPVTDLTATVNETSNAIDLTWTNPSDGDLAGILVVSGSGVVVDFVPTDGMTYNANDNVGTDQVAISVALGTTAAQATPVPGLDYEFSVWAFDDAQNYSTPEVVNATKNSLGTQTGSISVSLANQTVTVGTQPANLTLAGTVVYDDPNNTITVSLGVTNDAARLLFNLKSLTTNLNQGTQAGSLFPPTTGVPYAYYGPEAIDVAAAPSRDLVITGVDGTVDPITFDVSFVDAPMLFGGNYGGDFTGLDTSLSGEAWDSDTTLTDNTGENLRQGTITRDGRFIYACEKQTPWVNIVDTTTLLFTAGANLATGTVGSCGGIALSADGRRVFVAFNDGSHYHGGDANNGGPNSTTTSVVLYDLDADTLTVNQQLTLVSADANGSSAYEMAVSPDGSTAAVTVAHVDTGVNHLWLVDLTTFTIIDADAVTVGDQPVILSTEGFAEYVAYGETGANVFVGFNDYRFTGSDAVAIDVVDTTTFAVTQIIPTTSSSKARGMVQVNGMLYYGDDLSELISYDLASNNAETILDLTTVNDSTGIVYEPLKNWLFVIDYSDVAVYDLATNTQVDVDGDSTNGVSTLVAVDQMRAHFHVMSPF